MKTHQPISIADAPHYKWGADCDGWNLVKARDLSVIEERMPPGSSEVRHWHTRSRQFFYVLDGALSVEIEGERRRLIRGQGVEIPPGTAHQVQNESDLVAAFLVISTPPSHTDRVEDGALKLER